MNLNAYNNGQRVVAAVSNAAHKTAFFAVDKVVLNPMRFVRHAYTSTDSFLAGVRVAIRGQARLPKPDGHIQFTTLQSDEFFGCIKCAHCQMSLGAYGNFIYAFGPERKRISDSFYHTQCFDRVQALGDAA